MKTQQQQELKKIVLSAHSHTYHALDCVGCGAHVEWKRGEKKPRAKHAANCPDRRMK